MKKLLIILFSKITFCTIEQITRMNHIFFYGTVNYVNTV